MDDPISALDANVKKKIFKHVFRQKFASKTRVLVTHAIDFLHLVDSIILLKAGRVVFKGPYEEVKGNAYLEELIAIHHSHRPPPSGTEEIVEEIKEVSLSDVESDLSATESESDSEEPKPRKDKARSLSVNLGNQTDQDKMMKG